MGQFDISLIFNNLFKKSLFIVLNQTILTHSTISCKRELFLLLFSQLLPIVGFSFPMKPSMSQIRPLTQLEVMTEATVVRLKLDAQEQTRLTQLGLYCGATIKVLQSAPNAPLLLAIGDGRIGVNYQTAQKIYVV